MEKNNTLLAIVASDYKRLVKKFNKEVVLPSSVVLLGDSLFGLFNNKAYFNNRIINRGIPGDTTKGVLNRLDQIIKIKPKIVILNIGSNDISRYNDGYEAITKRILQIKFLLEENIKDVEVHILSLSPVLRDNKITNMTYMRNRTNKLINEINDELNIYTTIIDVNGCLSDNSGNLKLSYTTDGLHLNKTGYDIFVKQIVQSIPSLSKYMLI